MLVQNKIDLMGSTPSTDGDWIACSANTGHGIENLKLALVRFAKAHGSSPADMLVNARQAQLLRSIGASLRSCLQGMDSGLTSDFLAVDLRTCVRLLGEISGETWNPDVLDTVFSRFCIGK